MDNYDKLILQNKAWTEEQSEKNPNYFKDLAASPKPKFLWIGCSDSRVPATQITDTEPGEMYVHRNIANLVVHTDLNLLSVLQYAVSTLKVEHIIVCGHYDCHGIISAFEHTNLGLMNKWLRNIKDVYRFNASEIDAIENNEAKISKLVELNVQEQVHNLAKTSIVQQAWEDGQKLSLHGWVFDIATGEVKEQININEAESVQDIYRYDLSKGLQY